MDQGTLIRAAQITLRRAIRGRFPPGPKREELRWPWELDRLYLHFPSARQRDSRKAEAQ